MIDEVLDKANMQKGFELGGTVGGYIAGIFVGLAIFVAFIAMVGSLLVGGLRMVLGIGSLLLLGST